MTLPFDAVLCDFDGVIRFYDTTALAALERDAGLPVGTTAEVAFAPEQDLPALLGEVTTQQWIESIASALAYKVPEPHARELASAFAGADFWVDEDVLDLLRRVQAYVPVMLVTNATTALEDDLAHLGLTHFADGIVSSARSGVVKPDRRIYEVAAERAGTVASRCLFIDDRAENVEAATALGMTGVLYGGIADLEKALNPILVSRLPA